MVMNLVPAILLIVLIWGAVASWRHYLEFRVDRLRLTEQVERSKMETERMTVFAETLKGCYREN